jgi:hypothetical protein
MLIQRRIWVEWGIKIDGCEDTIPSDFFRRDFFMVLWFVTFQSRGVGSILPFFYNLRTAALGQTVLGGGLGLFFCYQLLSPD